MFGLVVLQLAQTVTQVDRLRPLLLSANGSLTAL
jgi:hypothetical protein